MVSGELDRPFDDEAVSRAARRASTTTVVDKDEEIVGQLAGTLPERHMFEYRCEGPRGVINGKVDRVLSSSDVAQLQTDWVNKTGVGAFNIRQVYVEGALMRETFTLKSIRER